MPASKHDVHISVPLSENDVTPTTTHALGPDRYRAIVEHANEGVWLLDMQARTTFVNRRMAEMLGYRPEEMIGRNAFDFVWHEDIERGRIEWERKRAPGESAETEFRFKHRDGSPRWFRCSTSVLRDAAGTSEGALALFTDITQRKANQEQLLESQERLKSVLENSLDAAYRRDLQTDTYDYLSPVVERVLGIAPERMRSLSIDEYVAHIHPDDRARAMQAVDDGFAQGKGRVEYRVRGDDGQWRFVADSFTIQHDEAGRPRWRTGTVRDVGEQKRAEDSLQESQLRVQLALESAFVISFDWDIRNDIVRRQVSSRAPLPATTESRPTNVEEFLSRIHPDDRETFRRNIDTALKSPDGHYENEFRLIGEDGGELWLFECGRIERDASGAPVRLVGLSQDITRRKHAELSLKETHQRLSSHIQNSPLAVIEFGPDLEVIAWSAAAETIFGWTADEVMGKRMWEIPWLPANELARVQAVSRDLYSGMTTRSVSPNRNLRKDGAEIWCEWYNSAIVGEPGHTRSVLSLVLDVTSRHKAMEEATRARTLAEAASSAKDHFLAVLSHELRTPLTPVLATVELLERDPTLPEEHREAMRMIRRNVALESRLIEDLLDHTRIARGKLTIAPKHIDVHEKIANVLRICNADVAAKALTVSTSFAAAERHVLADPARFQQVLWNILKNAIKFTPEGGRIHIATRNQPMDSAPGERPWLSIEVRDSGIGIAPEFLPRVFDAFEQQSLDVTRRFGGLGLGLAISKALVEIQGGRIRAESPGPGHGATFGLDFPTVVAPAAAGSRRGPHGHDSLDLSVLLVEDHVDSRVVLTRVLQHAGCRVMVAGSVGEAIERAAAEPFDLLISDIGLPDGTGHELVRRLRQRGEVRAIALSGYGADEDVAASLAAGFTAHLAKPVDLRLLEQTLRKMR